MVLKSRENSLGAWSFLIGVILAIIVGVFTTWFPIDSLKMYSPQIYGLLVLLGLFVGGFIKVEGKDSQTFLVASTVLVIVSRFGMDSVRGSLIGIGVGDMVSSVFGALLALFVPATIITALKTVFSVTKV